MKEVILKADIAKVIRDEIDYWNKIWLSSELVRSGALEALKRINNKLIYQTCSDLKGGEKQ